MKKFKYLLIACLAISLFSCEDDDIVKLNDSEYVPASNIEGFGTTLEISKPQKAETVTISYTPASYGVDIVKTHKLQFATSEDFSDPMTFDVDASDNSFSFSVGALNEFLTEDLALTVDEEATVSARVMTYSLNGVDTLYSSPVNFKTTPYLDILFAENTFYLFGDGVGRIAQNNKLKLNKVFGEPDDSWTIVWMEATGTFKLCSDVNYKGVIGKVGDPVDGEYTLGTVENRGEDIPVPGTAGYYTVGVNMATNKLMIEPANVYITGPNVDAWPVSSVTEENRFKQDTENKTMYLTKSFLGGELRLHVTHPYISASDWWHAEFIFLDGKIEYRADGGDQERVNIDGGEKTIELDFINQTGKIK
ncbi:SusE domain-containing protein [Sunxiuqinia elliptica]|uniref:SusE-like outer membrane protein n=1 Tax=Sunxiuqinia elliptica TaxID=655355 RepID=A0A4R6H027_9BACT|nr:SusE domain-containing protein [Sunxiuqinia elliptica]TDO01302.1 SusE-like outer membrane protein [Sunxiuqinia elliptica]TDO57813.1 SusE-like outer membrane protein [Sunxiuqinia elliptica]